MIPADFHPVQVKDFYPWLPREVTLAAYEVYCELHGPQAAMVNGGCRGGFGWREIVAYLYARSFPRTEWETRFASALRTPPAIPSQGNESGSARDSSPTTGNESSDSRLKEDTLLAELRANRYELIQNDTCAYLSPRPYGLWTNWHLMERAIAEIERLNELVHLLNQEARSLTLALSEGSNRSGCPCVYTTPCDPRCTCVDGLSSRGCDHCATYGSLEQRKAAAERLAAYAPYVGALEAAMRKVRGLIVQHWSGIVPGENTYTGRAVLVIDAALVAQGKEHEVPSLGVAGSTPAGRAPIPRLK